MSEYIGNPGERIEFTGRLTGEGHYTTGYGWRGTEMTVYRIEDNDGNVIVWKTSTLLGIESTDERGNMTWDGVHKGDTFTAKATVKDHSEYQGVKQTVITRVKVSSITHGLTKAERDKIKADEQLASLQEKDFVWCMPYKQYKEHYSDCETVAGTFRNRYDGRPVIDVIIRDGRLVPSGTRGRHYKGFQFETSNIGATTYYAISEETARRRLLKDFPETTDADWELIKIFNYQKWED